jgi:hypothetical protein
MHIWFTASLIFKNDVWGIVPLIKELLGKTTPVIYSDYFNRAILCSGTYDVDHNNNTFLTVDDGLIN